MALRPQLGPAVACLTPDRRGYTAPPKQNSSPSSFRCRRRKMARYRRFRGHGERLTACRRVEFQHGHAGPYRPLGALTSMVQQMAQTPQPRLMSSWLSAFVSFDAVHGWAVNFFVVVALAAVGAAYLSARRCSSTSACSLALCSAWPSGFWLRTLACCWGRSRPQQHDPADSPAARRLPWGHQASRHPRGGRCGGRRRETNYRAVAWRGETIAIATRGGVLLARPPGPSASASPATAG